jgi:hypothetical protein
MVAKRQKISPLSQTTQSFVPKNPLNETEKQAIIIAVQSAFMKLKNLYDRITPIFDEFGFTAPSAGVIARDLSEKIETSIIQHCRSFHKGLGHSDLARGSERWEVKICKQSGLSINQSAIISGENYIVANYSNDTEIKAIWVLWQAQDDFFSERKRNANIRHLRKTEASSHIQILFPLPQAPTGDG